MIVYQSGFDYIESCSSLKAKIAAIDAIIDALILAAGKAATKDYIEEYWLHDGQTQIKAIYKGADAVERSINAYERMRQRYQNRLHGRVTRLTDSKNFTG